MDQLEEDSDFRRVFKAGDVVFREGEPGEGAFIVDSGQVEIVVVRQGQEIRLATLGHGEIFGEMALIDNRPRSATVRALTDASCLVVRAEQIQNRLRGTDIITGMLLRLLLNRFRSMQNAMGAPRDDLPAPSFKSLTETTYIDQYEIARERLKFEQQLQRGLRDRQFRMMFQPIIRLSDQHLMGFEALIRWQHPEHGLISPDRFIAVAEEAGLIQAIDSWVLQSAATSLKQMHSVLNGSEKPHLHVNLSGVCFVDDQVVDNLKTVLDETGIDPASLSVEITEGVLIANPQLAFMILGAIKKLGVSVVLDDFGTGYSSLSYLHKFPIDGLKIDISFVRDMMISPTSEKIVLAIVELARALNLRVVAEGIEDEAEATKLIGMRCEFGQGFWYSRPLELDAAIAFAKEKLGQ